MLKIQGGHSLSGVVTISGSKNAAAPIISAALLFDSAILHNVPRIGDVFNLLEIVKSFGVSVDFTGNDLRMQWVHPSDDGIDRDRMKKIRISILLLPSLLQKFGHAVFPFPGGCNIGKRPIGEHISGLVDLGYQLSTDNDMYHLSGTKKSGEIHLHANRMVTATENLLTASVLREGTTVIHNAAYEPHVIDLVNSLRSAGVSIETRYNHQIVVHGVASLPKQLEYTITSDYLESGTFVIIGALASAQYIDIMNARIADLDAFLERAHSIGVRTENLGNDTLRVFRSRDLVARDIQTNIFP